MMFIRVNIGTSLKILSNFCILFFARQGVKNIRNAKRMKAKGIRRMKFVKYMLAVFEKHLRFHFLALLKQDL